MENKKSVADNLLIYKRIKRGRFKTLELAKTIRFQGTPQGYRRAMVKHLETRYPLGEHVFIETE